MPPIPRERERECLKHDIGPAASVWASRRQSSHVTRHLIQCRSLLGEELTDTPSCCEMRDGSHSIQLEGERCLTAQSMTSIAIAPEERCLTEDLIDLDAMLDSLARANDDDALRAAYAQRHALVLDSTSPELAPHIVITPPEEMLQDCYTPWLNAIGPQWPTHLMVTLPPNAFDHSLMYVPASHLAQTHEGPAPCPRTVFRPSRFKTFVGSLMRESVCMYDIVNALQRHHRKATAFAASEIARSFLNCSQYICPSEKPFRWTDPAEPFLHRRNQYRGTIVIESPSPYRVPHIVINEPPPQDPWIPWHNATTAPQDHGFGRYLVVPHRPVVYSNTPDGEGDYWGSSVQRASESELSDSQDYFEDMDYSESSSSESEPGTPGPDSVEKDQDSLSVEILRTTEDANIFDSPDESPWRGIMDRYPHQSKVPGPDSDRATDFTDFQPFDDEDELPPFDEWYQSVASRTAVIVKT